MRGYCLDRAVIHKWAICCFVGREGAKKKLLHLLLGFSTQDGHRHEGSRNRWWGRRACFCWYCCCVKRIYKKGGSVALFVLSWRAVWSCLSCGSQHLRWGVMMCRETSCALIFVCVCVNLTQVAFKGYDSRSRKLLAPLYKPVFWFCFWTLSPN